MENSYCYRIPATAGLKLIMRDLKYENLKEVYEWLGSITSFASKNIYDPDTSSEVYLKLFKELAQTGYDLTDKGIDQEEYTLLLHDTIAYIGIWLVQNDCPLFGFDVVGHDAISYTILSKGA